MESSGTPGVEPASTLEGPDVAEVTTVTAGVDSGPVGAVSVVPGTRGVLWGTPGAVVAPVHLVQIVEVEVNVTVETVVPVLTIDEPAVEIVLVTGQVVTVVYVMTVTVESGGTEEPPAGTEGVAVPAGGAGEVTGEVTGELPLGTAGVDSAGEVAAGGVLAGEDSVGGVPAPVVSVTGQTVV